MVRTVYGDVLLLVDFCMNFFVLYTTAIILRRRTKTVCIGGAALIGGIYSVIRLFAEGNSIFDCVISLLVGGLMCYMAFGGYNFIKTCIVFFGSSAMLGGIMFATYYLIGRYHIRVFSEIEWYAVSHIPVWLFFVLAAISLAISWAFSYIGRERSDKDEEDVIIEYMGRTACVKLMMDSGNLAKEPISGKHVILLNKSKSRKLLGEELYSCVIKKDSEKLLLNRFRLICAYDISGECKTYYAFLPRRLYAKNNKSKIELDAYIAICDCEVVFGGCDGLAHPSVIV